MNKPFLWLLAALAVLGLLWLWLGRDWQRTRIWSLEELATAEEGSFRDGVRAAIPPAFTVTSWNVQYGKELAKVFDALSTSFGADFVLLQEVDRWTERSGKPPRDLPRILARRLRMHYAYGIEFQELGQDAAGRPAFTGQLTLSKFPLVESEAIFFETQLADWSRGILGLLQRRNGGRMFLYSRARLGESFLHLYNVHLESQASDEGKALQMREVLAHVERNLSPEEPVILAGDFNTDRSGASPVIELLREEGFEDPLWEREPETVVTKKGEGKRLDWIFSRGLVVLDLDVAEDFHGSDHRALRATYETPGR